MEPRLLQAAPPSVSGSSAKSGAGAALKQKEANGGYTTQYQVVYQGEAKGGKGEEEEEGPNKVRSKRGGGAF